MATSSSFSSSGCLVQSFQNHSPPSKGTKSPGSQANPPLPIPARYCLLCPVHCLQPPLTALQAGRSSRAAQHRPAAPSPAGQPVRRRTASQGALRHPQHRVRTAQEPRLGSGCCPSPSSPPGRRAAGCLSPGRAGVSRGLMAAAPKIAVSSTHLVPRPEAFWQAKAEIRAGALLSINCWALQIKASPAHRGLPGA